MNLIKLQAETRVEQIAKVIIVIVGAIALVLGYVAPVAPHDQITSHNQSFSVLNGILYPDSNDFFDQGRSLLDQEIKILVDQQEATTEDILKIDPNIQQQQEIIKKEGLSLEGNREQGTGNRQQVDDTAIIRTYQNVQLISFRCLRVCALEFA